MKLHDIFENAQPLEQQLRAYIMGDLEFRDLPEEVQYRIADYYRADIPYGYQTGDEGTTDEWVDDHIASIWERAQKIAKQRGSDDAEAEQAGVQAALNELQSAIANGGR